MWRWRLIIKFQIMRRIFIHAIPFAISFLWLLIQNHTSNPFALKGPDFLRFYLVLIFGFYTLTFVLNYVHKISETTFYCLGLIFLIGTIKLFIGMILGKPVGFLIMILIAELIVFLILKRSYLT